MKKFFRKFRRKNKFEIRNAGEVVIDGKEMIIVGHSAGNDRLSVDFIPKSEYLLRDKRGK